MFSPCFQGCDLTPIKYNMMKKSFIAMIAVGMYMCSSADASAQGIALFSDVVSPVDQLMIADGYFMNTVDLRFAPQRDQRTMMHLQGSPRKMVQKVVMNRLVGVKDKGVYPDTVYFTPDCNISRIAVPAFKAGGLDMAPERVEVTYTANGKIDYMTRFSKSQFSYGFKDRKDITRYVYDNNGNLLKEVFNMYMLEGGKWQQQQSFKDQVDIAYGYNAQGELETAEANALQGLVFYNAKGLITKISREDGYEPKYIYTYDEYDRMSGFTGYVEEDGVDDTEYFKDMVTFTRDIHGDITSCVKTRHTCNSKWRVTRKGLPKTYKVAYTRDAQGNWTRATITQGKLVVATITRVFTY